MRKIIGMHMPSKNVDSVVDDARTIKSVASGPSMWIVGDDGISKIVAYRECGDNAHVPWLAMMNEKGNIIKRMDARNVIIEYVTEVDDLV